MVAEQLAEYPDGLHGRCNEAQQRQVGARWKSILLAIWYTKKKSASLGCRKRGSDSRFHKEPTKSFGQSRWMKRSISATTGAACESWAVGVQNGSCNILEFQQAFVRSIVMIDVGFIFMSMKLECMFFRFCPNSPILEDGANRVKGRIIGPSFEEALGSNAQTSAKTTSSSVCMAIDAQDQAPRSEPSSEELGKVVQGTLRPWDLVRLQGHTPGLPLCVGP